MYMLTNFLYMYVDDPAEFVDAEMPFSYTKEICGGLQTPSNIWMPIKGKVTSESESKKVFPFLFDIHI